MKYYIFIIIILLSFIPLVNAFEISEFDFSYPSTTNYSAVNVNHSVFSDTAITALNWYTNSLGSLNDASDTQFNNDGGALTIDNSWLTSFGNNLWFKLDQTTPQTIINGIPLLDTTPNGGADLKSFVNKEYVDLAVTSLGAAYYMYDEDDATGYKTTYLTPSGDAETYIEVADLNDNDYIGGWISASGEEPQKLLKGIYDWYLTAEKTTGTETLRVYWELIERKSDTTEVVIATSSNSNELNGKTSYIVPLQLTEDYIPDSGSRIVGKLYADVSGSGNAPTIRVYYQGETSSRWEIPANSEIFQNIFVPYNGAVQNVDLGNKNLTTTGTIDGKLANETDPTFNWSNDPNLINWWTMDDLDGTTLIDKMGRNNGTIINQTAQDEGTWRKGLTFDGDGDYVNLTNYENTDEIQNLSVSVWFKMDVPVSSSNQVILGIGDSFNRIPWIWHVKNTKTIKAQVYDGVTSIQTQSGDLNPDTWYHLVFTTNDTNSALYIDGELVDIKGVVSAIGINSEGMGFIGKYSTTNPPTGNIVWDGNLDEVMIFNKTLTPEEVKEIFALNNLKKNIKRENLVINGSIGASDGHFEKLFSKTLTLVNGIINGNLTVLDTLKIGSSWVSSSSAYFAGEVTIDGSIDNSEGSITSSSGVFDYLTYDYSDPKIEGWFPVDRSEVILFAQNVFAYPNGVIDFFNNETRCYEVFEPSTGIFYEKECLQNMKILEQVEPVINTDVEEVTKINKLTGKPEIIKVPKYSETYDSDGIKIKDKILEPKIIEENIGL